MVKLFFVLLLIGIPMSSYSIRTEYNYLNDSDSSYNCYMIVLPDSGQITGVVLRDYSSLPPPARKSRFHLHEIAADSGYASLITVSSNLFPELFLDETGPKMMDDLLAHALEKYDIPNDRIFVGGISASGTRALRFAQYCEQGKSKYKHKIAGVFVVDSPIDQERFYISSQHILNRNNPIGNLWEADLMIKTFDEQLGGSPKDYYQRYVDASVFTYSDTSGGNVKYYRNLPIIIYHEPDIDWWVQNRGESYYEFNSVDLVAFVIKLRDLGNSHVTLVTTSNKGFDSMESEKHIHGQLLTKIN